MGRRVWVCAVLSFALAVRLGRAQALSPAYPTDSLRRGNLVIWLVSPSESAPGPPVAQPYATYTEQTAGSFGQTASSVGQPASNTGQTAGSFGAPAGSTGRPSSEVGQTAGDFGTVSSNVGQTAGSYGQVSSAPLGRQPTAPPLVRGSAAGSPEEPLQVAWKSVTALLRNGFPGLHLQVTTVRVDDLQARLAAGADVGAYPDVLLGLPNAEAVTALLLHDARIATLGQDVALEPLRVAGKPLRTSEAAVLGRARHPEEARAFAFWLGEDGLCPGCSQPHVSRSAEGPAAVAGRAVETVLSGGELGGDADPATARVSGGLARRLTLGTGVPLDGLTLRTEVLSGVANERLAAVGLRVTVSSGKAFGVIHPAVVLRRGEDGRWRVLQISYDLPRSATTPTLVDALAGFTRPVPATEVRPVARITPAAPLDGDSRSGTPELWWDNPGDAGLLAVEWQTVADARWSDSHLLFVPDRGPRLQVRVSATFAHANNEYRWRVWSVGEGGAMNLSEWRRFTVLP